MTSVSCVHSPRLGSFQKELKKKKIPLEDYAELRESGLQLHACAPLLAQWQGSTRPSSVLR